jgi:glutaredoxin
VAATNSLPRESDYKFVSTRWLECCERPLMRMIEAPSEESPLLLEVDGQAAHAAPLAAPARSFSGFPASSFRTCVTHGLPMDASGDCAQCSHERTVAAARLARRRWITALAAFIALLSLAGFGYWRSTRAERLSKLAATTISQRYPGQLVVYTMQGCGACSLAKQHMDAQGIPYVARPIDSDPTAVAEMEYLNARLVVPTFVVGDEVMEGFDPSGITLNRAMAKHGIKRQPGANL